MLLTGRKAIVTGASSGIGKATAQRLGPLGHMGSADDIAAAVAWAASGEAAYVTGTTIVVDGGMSLYPRFV